jgi:hypothetical protein
LSFIIEYLIQFFNIINDSLDDLIQVFESELLLINKYIDSLDKNDQYYKSNLFYLEDVKYPIVSSYNKVLSWSNVN